LREAIVQLRRDGSRVGAILPVDFFGKAANYSKIESIASEFDIPVLADSAESVGSFFDGKPTGSFGEASIFSFNGNKIMTTSGGGMLLTNSSSVEKQVRFLASQARDKAIHYQHSVVGFNYRLSNILAALGRAQLSRLDLMIARRRGVREIYRELFALAPGVSIFDGGDDTQDNCWLTAVLVDESVSGFTPAALASFLAEKQIETRPLWKPMHLQPLYSKAPALIDGTSEKLFNTGLALPSGSGMSEADLARVSEEIRVFLTR